MEAADQRALHKLDLFFCLWSLASGRPFTSACPSWGSLDRLLSRGCSRHKISLTCGMSPRLHKREPRRLSSGLLCRCHDNLRGHSASEICSDVAAYTINTPVWICRYILYVRASSVTDCGQAVLLAAAIQPNRHGA